MSYALSTPRRFNDADDLIDHLEMLGATSSADVIGMTELDHGLQCAALLKAAAPNDLELQVAGLIHDLAHPWDEPGQPRHARMGAIAIADLLGDRIADLILGHVPAKRYLTATQPEYLELLSIDSVTTLQAQGGPMNADEIADFESHPDADSMVLLRIADDRAKTVGTVVPGLETWVDALRVVAAAHLDG
jgi:predicted HD phosphohydrolase